MYIAQNSAKTIIMLAFDVIMLIVTLALLPLKLRIVFECDLTVRKAEMVVKFFGIPVLKERMSLTDDGLFLDGTISGKFVVNTNKSFNVFAVVTFEYVDLSLCPNVADLTGVIGFCGFASLFSLLPKFTNVSVYCCVNPAILRNKVCADVGVNCTLIGLIKELLLQGVKNGKSTN